MNEKSVNNTINLLIAIHKSNSLIQTFCIVGSFVKNKSLSHDIDCICINGQDVYEYYFKNLPLLIKEKITLKRIDDSLHLLVNGIEFGLVYFLKDQFYRYVDNLIEGKFLDIETKPWVIGGKIPEVLLTDIVFADIKFDKENRFINLQNILKKTYPIKLKNNLIRYLEDELISKIKIVERLLTNADYLRFDLGISEIYLICIRLMFAQNNLYLPPIKHLIDGLYDIPPVCKRILNEIILSARIDDKKERLRLIKKVSLSLLQAY